MPFFWSENVLDLQIIQWKFVRQVVDGLIGSVFLRSAAAFAICAVKMSAVRFTHDFFPRRQGRVRF